MDRNGQRPPPAYQQYAASRLADRNFKSMTAIERGVLHTTELECWANTCVPANPSDLARVLGLEVAEVQAGLSERVMVHFQVCGDVLVHPELEAYRAMLTKRKAAMSAGGKQTAATINKRREAVRHPDSLADREADSPLDKTRPVQIKPASREALNFRV